MAVIADSAKRIDSRRVGQRINHSVAPTSPNTDIATEIARRAG